MNCAERFSRRLSAGQRRVPRQAARSMKEPINIVEIEIAGIGGLRNQFVSG